MDPIDTDKVAISDEDVADVNEFSAEQLADEKTDWKALALERTGIARRRTTALKRAKDALGKVKPTEQTPPANQAPEKGKLDYGQKAYLATMGFKDAEDHKYVEQAMKDTGKSLDEVIASPFITGELKQMGEERATKAAMPAADGRSGSPARDSVDYWIAKGELPPADQVELRRKVVAAKYNKQKNTNVFTQNAVVGSA